MRKITLLGCLLASILMIAGCSSIETPKGSSTGYKSYRLYKEMPSGTTAFANREDEVHSLLQNEINAVFKAKGLEEADQDAELIVAYLVLVQNNAVSTGIDDYYTNSGSEIVQYAHKQVTIKKDMPKSFEAGTLIIDVIDANDRKLIYRDYSSKEILPELSLAERNQRAKDAVDEALAKFFR